MNLAKWRQEVHHNLEELVAKANRIVPGLMYGALSACTIMPLVTAANQGQVPTSEISNLVGALGMGLITNQLQNWHDRNNDELAAELTDKAKTDSDWKEVLDELLQKLETLHIVQTVASEADKDWLIHTIKDALEVIGSRLVIQIENISNSTGVVIGQNNTQTITQITNHYYQSEKSIDKVILEEQIRKYLEFVRERYGTVSLRNTKSESIYPLVLSVEQAYVPLKAKPLMSTIQKDIDMRELFSVSDTYSYRLVITGEPGAGKTTVLQYMACTFAKALLEDNKELVAQSFAFALDELPIPILVPLGEYIHFYKNDKYSSPHERTFAKFINSYIYRQHEGLLDILPDFFNYLVRRGQYLLLLLDGFDEILLETDRIRIREVIEKLSADLHIVVTCRTSAYGGRTAFGGFQAITIKPLDEEQRERLVKKAYGAVKGNDDIEHNLQLQQLLSIIQNHNVKLRFDSPLMISLLLLIYNDEARRLSISAERFPRHRAELYMLATENLLRSDYSLSERETLQFLQSEVAYSYDEQEHWIEIAAWVLHRLGEKPRAEPISRLDLKDELCKIYGQPEGAVAEFLKMVQQRSSLLEWNKGQYQFTHFAFQEFMVARYLCDVELEKKNRGIVPWLFSEGLIGANRWREPLLLAAGYLAINESKIAMLFIEMLASINQQEHTNISMLYASLELALAACEEWFANDPNYLEYYKMISERTVRLLLEGGNPQQRTTAGRALGRVGDARPGINIKESLPDILWSDPILSGVFIMGEDDEWAGGKQFECQLINQPYRISCYPITVKQYHLFVEAGGYNNENYWTKEGWQWRIKPNPDSTITIQEPETHKGVEQLSNYPQTGISWFEAVAYCNWLSEKLPMVIRLPTEYEWERAARHTDGRLYTWGNTFDKQKCNCSETGIGSVTSVGLFPEGNSVCGASDLNGHISEWCGTKWLPDYKDYESQADSSIEGSDRRVLRGGSFFSDQFGVLSAFREGTAPTQRNSRIGFRIIAELIEIGQHSS